MNIYALKGNKVRFTGENGYDSQIEFAKKVLTVGEIYTVDHTDVGQSSTDVYLEGFYRETYNGGKVMESFNSVMFEDVEPQEDSKNKLHKDYKMWEKWEKTK